jgi:hypothetical protein
MKTLLPVVLGLAAPVLAQSAPWQGFLFNWNKPALASHISQYTRFNTGAESNLNRIDRDDHKSWGENAAGNVVIRGLALWITDTNYTTAESFSFVGHAEDAANPNFPLATPAFTVANIPMPPGTAGQAFLVNGTINVDVTIPGAGDVFVGIGVPAMPGPTQPFDGLFIGTVLRGGVGLAVFDEPGPRGQQGAVGGVARDDYVCGILNGVAQYQPASATSLSQLAIDVAINNGGIGGVALTETVQTSLLSSNAPFGTSDFLSGLHPDLNGLQPGRADNIGFGITHHVGQMPVGTPVLVQLALARPVRCRSTRWRASIRSTAAARCASTSPPRSSSSPSPRSTRSSRRWRRRRSWCRCPPGCARRSPASGRRSTSGGRRSRSTSRTRDPTWKCGPAAASCST